MLSRLGKMAACILLLVVFTLVNSPLPVRADGGVIVGYDLWIALKEGQQIAVITIQNKDTTKIDLFISILDKTNESHEVGLFPPFRH